VASSGVMVMLAVSPRQSTLTPAVPYTLATSFLFCSALLLLGFVPACKQAASTEDSKISAPNSAAVRPTSPPKTGPCCDPRKEPGHHGQPLCYEGHYCCADGKWKCGGGLSSAAPEPTSPCAAPGRRCEPDKP